MRSSELDRIKSGKLKITDEMFKNILIDDKVVALTFLEKVSSDHEDINKIIEKIDSKLFNDLGFVSNAVGVTLEIIPYASKEVKNNKEFWLTVLNTSEYNTFSLVKYFKNIPSSLRKDLDIIIRAITSVDSTHLSKVVKIINKDVFNNKDMVLKILDREGIMYQYLNNELKNDKECQELALSRSGLVIQFIPKELIDLELMKFAVNKFPFALLYGPKEYRTNEELILSAISAESFYPYIFNENKTHEFLIKLVDKNPAIITRILRDYTHLRDDKDFLNQLAIISEKNLKSDVVGYENYLKYKREDEIEDKFKDVDKQNMRISRKKI